MKYLQPLFCTVSSAIPKWSLLVGLGLITWLPSTPALADHGDSCRDARRIPVDHIFDGSLGNAEDVDIFRLDLSAPGLLAVEMTHRGLDSRNPTLTYLGTDCERALIRGIAKQHSSSQHLLRIDAAGSHYFRVASSDPMPTVEAAYRLHVAFADARDPRQTSEVELSFVDTRCVRGFWPPGFHKLEEPPEEWEEDTGDPPPPPPDCSVPDPPPECKSAGFYKLEEPPEEWEEDTGDPSPDCSVPDPPPECVTGFYKLEEPPEEWEEDSGDPPPPPPDCSVPDPPPECKSAETDKLGMIWTCDGAGNRDGVRFQIRGPGVVDLEARRTTDATEAIRLNVRASLREGEYVLRLPPGQGFADGDVVRGRFYAICPGTDDHGETFGCASEVEAGTWLAAEIRGDGVPDRDTFTFVLDSREMIILESHGDLDTYGELFREDGRRLAADDDQGRFENFRIIETLGPGRYYLRVAAMGHGEGAYSLRTNILRDVPETVLVDE